MEMIFSSQELDSKQGQNTSKRNPVAEQCPNSIDPPQAAPSEDTTWMRVTKIIKLSRINSEFKKNKKQYIPIQSGSSQNPEQRRTF